jgi:hypothetical protein
MIKKSVTQTKNTPPVRSGALIVSLFIQLIALVVIGIVSLHYGALGVLIALLLAAGYVLLALQTFKLMQNKISDSGSALTVIHIIASVVAVLIVTGFISIYTSLPF